MKLVSAFRIICGRDILDLINIEEASFTLTQYIHLLVDYSENFHLLIPCLLLYGFRFLSATWIS